MSEAELIKKIQAGNISALKEIFEIYKDDLLRYCCFITGSRFASEDIVQESFIECFKSIKNLKNPEMFKSWFYRIATRTAWKYCADEKKVIPIKDIYEKADAESIDKSINLFIREEEAKVLHGEIEKLDLKQKSVIILYYFNGFSIKEIAEIMGCFEGTVKSRLHNARKNLKESLIENAGIISGRNSKIKNSRSESSVSCEKTDCKKECRSNG